MNGDSASLLPLDDGFRLDGWTVMPRAYELVRPGETVHVQPKPMEVLVYLAAHAGQTVTRDELMDAVWAEVYVTEHALNRCVSQLRKLFDDDAREPRVIETIPKAGYRLVAPVEWLPGDSAGAPLDALDLTVTLSPAAAIPVPRARPGLAALVLVALLGIVGLAGWILSSARPATPAPTTRPLTVTPGREGQGAWSPDGTRLAFSHQGGGDAEGLYVQALGVDAPLRLTDAGEGQDVSPVWSPDGSTLFFARCGARGCDVYSVPSLGGTPRLVAEGPVWGSGFSMAPDGRTIALSVPDSSRSSIALLDLESGTRRVLLAPPPGYRDGTPAFSPDGTALVFQRSNRVGTDLYRVATTGGEVLRLTTDNRHIAGHAWAADGRSILFSSARTGVYALWRIGARGGTPQAVLGPAVRDPGGPAVAPVGQRLAVEDWVFEINLWESTADGAAPVRRVASTLWDKQPHLSADGQRIVFVSNRTGFPEVWAAARDGSVLQRLTRFEGASVEHPRLSPDGQRIVFQVRTAVQADLYLHEPDGLLRRLTTTEDADEVAPRWSRDGQSVYFGSNADGTWQIWKISVADGEAAPVTTEGGYTAEEAPDGALLLTRYAEAGLWRETESGAVQVSEWPELGNTGSWAMTDAGVFVIENRPGASQLLAIDPLTGTATPQPHRVVRPIQHEPSLTASADGRLVVMARIDRIESDLLLVEPFE